jgi:hypothetical protein
LLVDIQDLEHLGQIQVGFMQLVVVVEEVEIRSEQEQQEVLAVELVPALVMQLVGRHNHHLIHEAQRYKVMVVETVPAARQNTVVVVEVVRELLVLLVPLQKVEMAE